MSIAPTLQKYLASENIQYEVIPHELSMTSARTAETCHISGDRLAKGIVLRRDDASTFLALNRNRSRNANA
jgi:Ala-tRNA(Pro) deacylase